MATPPANLSIEALRNFLNDLGARFSEPTALYLLGGSALRFLGSPRPTLDVDYVGSDLPDPSDYLQTTIQEVANTLGIEVEGVPFDGFIPVPLGAEQRHILIGQFGFLSTYVFDPYSIALSKIDRGFESDFDDILFLVKQGYIEMPKLESIVQDTIPLASRYLVDPKELQAHFNTIKQLISGR